MPDGSGRVAEPTPGRDRATVAAPHAEPAVSVPSVRGRSGLRGSVAHRLRRGAGRLAEAFDQRSRFDRVLTLLLAAVVGVIVLAGLPDLLAVFPAGIDLEIPLRAASHWSSGTQAYPPSAMLVQSGPDLPYLYPPFLLPLLTPIAALPRQLVIDAWLVVCFLAAVWTCRRLGIPWIAVPFVLAWPPFAEGLIVGNVQILAFASFVALLYVPGDGPPRQREFRPSQDLPNGLAAAGVGVLKTAQLLPVLYLARRRFRSAAIAVAALAAVVLVTLPFTGIGIYFDWLAQLQRAADPAWTIGGVSLTHRVGIPDVLLLLVGTVMALSIRGRDSAAWLGVALVVSTPSVHGYTFLFLLPALAGMRRDAAIGVAALFVGLYHGYAWWTAFLFVVYMLVAANKWPWLRLICRTDASAAAGAASTGSAAGGTTPPLGTASAGSGRT
jgi:hypothetical protein